MVISGRLQLRRALLTFALDKNKGCVSMSDVSPFLMQGFVHPLLRR